MGHRYNVGLTGQSAELVHALKEKGYSTSDVIVEALSLFDFAIQEIASGKQFGSIDESLDGKSVKINSVVTQILRHAGNNPDFLQDYSHAKPSLPAEPSTKASTARKSKSKDKEAVA